MPKNYKYKYRDLLKSIDNSLEIAKDIIVNKAMVSDTERESISKAFALFDQLYVLVNEAKNENYYEKGNN